VARWAGGGLSGRRVANDRVGATTAGKRFGTDIFPFCSYSFLIISVQYGAPAQESIIKTVAICAGSGGSMFKDVKADLYWTGEMGHVSPGVRPFLLKSDGRICRQTQRRSGY
jgi:putative NIF3 family GTP cyclohydrolase 1 type 2